MKLLIRDYVASLKERQELDAILPDLLSELGFNVISRPQRGTTQRGVDIVAVGNRSGRNPKLYLFAVKPGDLTRQEWDGNSQKLRPSLNEIMDEYIPTRIPAAYRRLKIVIVICVGGDVHESVRSLVTQFTKKHTKGKISFEEWNGDKIAELLLSGILREELLPKPLRSSFQKAVAMVDQPDISYDHFARLLVAVSSGLRNEKAVVQSARQMYICLWVLFVWARDADNLDSPYRASELALLKLWEMVKPFIGKRTRHARAVVSVLQHVIDLHIRIGALFIESKILPNVGRRQSLSTAVPTHASVDVNLGMFETLGRLAMTAHWSVWAHGMSGTDRPEFRASLDKIVQAGMQMISNNPALFLPLQDQQAIEITLFLMLAVNAGAADDMHVWLREITKRLDFSVRTNGQYPCCFKDYRDLIDHPKDRSDEYRKEALPGSVLIPLLAAWLAAFKDQLAFDKLTALKTQSLQHCTLQLWLPGKESEKHIYINDETHGTALADLPLIGDGSELLETIAEACNSNQDFSELSAYRTGYWPVILAACRHYRLPVPPQFWIQYLATPRTGVATSDESSHSEN